MSYSRLTFSQRLTIQRLLRYSVSQSEIARRIGVHRSTVSHELRRNSWEGVYSARIAQGLAMVRSERYSEGSKTQSRIARTSRTSIPDFFANQRRYVALRKRRCKQYGYRKKREQRKRYEWKMSFQARAYRLTYLRQRERNHWKEGYNRRQRDRFDWKFYNTQGWSLINRKSRGRFFRNVIHDLTGLLKGPYRERNCCKMLALLRFLERRRWRWRYRKPGSTIAGYLKKWQAIDFHFTQRASSGQTSESIKPAKTYKITPRTLPPTTPMVLSLAEKQRKPFAVLLFVPQAGITKLLLPEPIKVLAHKFTCPDFPAGSLFFLLMPFFKSLNFFKTDSLFSSSSVPLPKFLPIS
jgi:hypothetical protein